MKRFIKSVLLILIAFSLISCKTDPKQNDPNNNNKTEETNDGSGVGTNEEIFN